MLPKSYFHIHFSQNLQAAPRAIRFSRCTDLRRPFFYSQQPFCVSLYNQAPHSLAKISSDERNWNLSQWQLNKLCSPSFTIEQKVFWTQLVYGPYAASCRLCIQMARLIDFTEKRWSTMGSQSGFQRNEWVGDLVGNSCRTTWITWGIFLWIDTLTPMTISPCISSAFVVF